MSNRKKDNGVVGCVLDVDGILMGRQGVGSEENKVVTGCRSMWRILSF